MDIPGAKSFGCREQIKCPAIEHTKCPVVQWSFFEATERLYGRGATEAGSEVGSKRPLEVAAVWRVLDSKAVLAKFGDYGLECFVVFGKFGNG